MTLGNKLRFSILERDGFKCAYCGTTPQNDSLVVDHIHPKFHGGEDKPENLITACFQCNSGKGARLLIPELNGSLKEKFEFVEDGILSLLCGVGIKNEIDFLFLLNFIKDYGTRETLISVYSAGSILDELISYLRMNNYSIPEEKFNEISIKILNSILKIIILSKKNELYVGPENV